MTEIDSAPVIRLGGVLWSVLVRTSLNKRSVEIVFHAPFSPTAAVLQSLVGREVVLGLLPDPVDESPRPEAA